MLIEAAKGGHTGVVSVLIDYNPNNLDPSGASGGVIPPGVSGPASTDTSAIEVSGEVVQCDTVAAVTAVTNTNSNPSGGPVPEDSLIPLTRFPAEGHEGHEGQQGNCPFRFHVIPCHSMSFHVIHSFIQFQANQAKSPYQPQGQQQQHQLVPKLLLLLLIQPQLLCQIRASECIIIDFLYIEFATIIYFSKLNGVQLKIDSYKPPFCNDCSPDSTMNSKFCFVDGSNMF